MGDQTMKLLVANRGEIARRVIRTARALASSTGEARVRMSAAIEASISRLASSYGRLS